MKTPPATYWTVPRMFEGRTVAVMASGPSMSQAVADRVRHLPRIAINTTYRLAPDADVIYGSDGKWWRWNTQALLGPGLKVSCEPLPNCPQNLPDGVLTLRTNGQSGYERNPAYVRTLNNSGGVGIQIAVHGGAARVLLLGFDMRGGHWHGDHPRGEFGNPGPGDYGRWCGLIERFAREVAPTGVSIINCTPGSALTCFPREDLDTVLRVAHLGIAA